MAKRISQLCDELQLTDCFSWGNGAIWRTPKHSLTSDKLQKQATAKATWETFSTNNMGELLVNVYSHRWWWKVCLDVVCMDTSFSQIQSHIIQGELCTLMYQKIKVTASWLPFWEQNADGTLHYTIIYMCLQSLCLSKVKVTQDILSHSFYMESEYSHKPSTYPVIYVQQLKQKRSCALS